MKVDLTGLIISSIFLLFGLVSAFFVIRCWLLARASRSWPSASGTIVKSFAQEHSTSDGPIGATTCIEYEYTVDQQRLSGRRIRFGAQRSMSVEKAQAIADRYPVGTLVPIYYNPSKPSVCTLEQAAWTTFVLVWGLLSLAFVIGSLIALVLLNK